MLQRLIAARGPSGDEGKVRAIIKELAAPLCDEIVVDALGNVIATRKGTDPSAPTVMLCAHMDEVGLIVRQVMEDGLLRYSPIGSIDPVVMASKRVLIGEKAVPGVIGSKAVHMQKPDEAKQPYTHRDLLIDIGAKDKKDALSMVSVGDYITFDSEYVEFGEGLVKASALDDRVGCYALLKALEKQYPCTVVAIFTVQEEVGTRGAKAAAARVNPDIGIVLEGTSAADTGDTPYAREVALVGDGPAISFMDLSSIANRPLMMALRAAADKNGIPWQVKRYVSGGNDAGAIQQSLGGAATCVISVPCRYIHSPASVCSLEDVENTVRLLDAFLASGAKI